MTPKLMPGVVRRNDGLVVTTWRLCVSIPDGVGVGCSHEHVTPEEALRCPEARAALRAFTGRAVARSGWDAPPESLLRALESV
jgi:hypothetical protein